MGKPSLTRVSKKSDHSFNSKSSKKMNVTMSVHKMGTKKKRIKAQAKKKIKKLFNKLRNDSTNLSLNSSQNSTVIEVLDNTVNESSPISNKRKRTDNNSNEKVKLRKSNSNPNFIIIKDDDDDVTTVTGRTSCSGIKTPRKKIYSPPIQCSTPISNNDKTLKELNISRVSSLKNNNNCNVAQNLNEELNSLTKEINQSSFLTIDLTTETDINKTNETNSQNSTVIDLINTSENEDCVFVSASNYSLSMSGDSDVTVLKMPMSKIKEKQIQKFAHGISQLNASQKGRLLELITQNVFNGCKTPKRLKKCSNTNTSAVKTTLSRATETAEDTYIKEIILGQTQSRNSIGSNIYNPMKDAKHKTGLRMVVIDGSNVAMAHGRGKEFSVKGLQICIDYFVKRGHVVKAFVPRFRCKFGKSSNPRLLDDLEKRALVVYTPSREIQGKFITSYDDRYIVQCAAEFDGVIVSGDNYRDLLQENSRWRFVIENRLLPFTWVNDMIMFPRDPLGRNGPTLEQFLRHQPANQQLLNIIRL